MRVAISGATGRLGRALVAAVEEAPFGGPFGPITWSRPAFDLDAPDAFGALLDRDRPEIVVHAAAWTDVDGCAREPELALARNGLATGRLAEACFERGIDLVVVSTNEIFDGRRTDGRGYTVDDRPNPINPYGVSKLAGEHEVLGAGGNHQVVRSSGLYGIRPCRAKGGNLIDTMYRVAAQQPEVRVVNDEVLTPTFTADLAAQIRVLALEGPGGLYHATNQGSCSWYEFARAIFDLGDLATPLRPTSVKDFAAPVRRPFYSVLENAALAAAGLDRMRPWRDALADYMAQRKAPDTGQSAR